MFEFFDSSMVTATTNLNGPLSSGSLQTMDSSMLSVTVSEAESYGVLVVPSNLEARSSSSSPLSWEDVLSDPGDATAGDIAFEVIGPAPSTVDSSASEMEGEGEEEEGEGETITVTGTRPRLPDTTTEPETSTGGGGPGDGGDGGGTESQQNDCRDRNALDATSDIKSENDNNVDEHASVVYIGSDGAVRHSPPIEGDTLGVPLSAILSWMSQNGVAMNQVIGLVHNHPAYEYGATDQSAAINRYPSGGDVAGGDWSVAGYMVSNGAGGAGGADFAMYLIDTAGNLREFAYADREKYENLSAQEREQGEELPDAMKDDGTSCG